MEKHVTDEQIDVALKEMGYEVREHRIPFLKRIKCRLMGPHDWIPIHAYDIVTKEVYEDGQICDVCGKELG